MSFNKSKEIPKADCDFCFQRKTHNAMIVHCLKMSEHDYREHLRLLYGKAGEDDGWIQSRINWHRFVWHHYGEKAKEEHKPIWQVYLESQGIRVKRAPSPDWKSLTDAPPF